MMVSGLRDYGSGVDGEGSAHDIDCGGEVIRIALSFQCPRGRWLGGATGPDLVEPPGLGVRHLHGRWVVRRSEERPRGQPVGNAIDEGVVRSESGADDRGRARTPQSTAGTAVAFVTCVSGSIRCQLHRR